MNADDATIRGHEMTQIADEVAGVVRGLSLHYAAWVLEYARCLKSWQEKANTPGAEWSEAERKAFTVAALMTMDMSEPTDADMRAAANYALQQFEEEHPGDDWGEHTYTPGYK